MTCSTGPYARVCRCARTASAVCKRLLDAFPERRSFEIISREKKSRSFAFRFADRFHDVPMAEIVLRQRLRMLPDGGRRAAR